MPAHSLSRLVEEFGGHLVAVDFPALPSERRQQTAAFAARRVAAMPTPMRAGVSVVATSVAAAGRVVGPYRLARLLARNQLPFFGDYVRLIRSLTTAYVWETWPSTAADGSIR